MSQSGGSDSGSLPDESTLAREVEIALKRASERIKRRYAAPYVDGDLPAETEKLHDRLATVIAEEMDREERKQLREDIQRERDQIRAENSALKNTWDGYDRLKNDNE